MIIEDISGFLQYYSKIRERTMRVILCIPPGQLEWTPTVGEFTFGDIIRHLAAIERYMYAENVQFRPSRYPGHGRDLADGYEAVMAFFDRMARRITRHFFEIE